MASLDPDRRSGQLTQPRIAEMVADILRDRIVGGEIPDGGFLPKQDDLIAEFRVARPSIREAMRILETEGLVSVRRGNVGGAEVHAPKSGPAAHMLGLVLQSQKVGIADLAVARGIVEPECAALCAGRADRHEKLVPSLEQTNEEAAEHLHDTIAFADVGRRWHSLIIDSCGNQTLILLVGTLGEIWAHHERTLADRNEAAGSHPGPELLRGTLDEHVRMTEAIAAGDAATAHRLARAHLVESQKLLLARMPDQPVVVTGMPSRLGRF